jgi:hypothetical protein
MPRKPPPTEIHYRVCDANWNLLRTETHRTPLQMGEHITLEDGTRHRIIGFSLTDEDNTWDVLTVPDPESGTTGRIE